VENFKIVEARQSLERSDERPPDLVIGEKGLFFLVLDNLLVKVPITGVVHNDAKGLPLVNE
jgi:hypothetical protein